MVNVRITSRPGHLPRFCDLRWPRYMLAVLAVASLTIFAEGQQVDFEYSKSMVPQDMIGEMKGNFVPVRREEFDRMIGESARSERRNFEQSHVIRATYRASFEDNSLVEGRASLVLTARPESESRLQLPSFDLPIIEPRWRPRRPAIVGRSADGSFTAIVPAEYEKGSGTNTLKFKWSMKGRRISASGSRIQVRLPPGPDNRLLLLLPEALQPKSTRGSVSRNPNKKSIHNWIIRLGSASETELEIYSPTLSDDAAPVLLFSDTASYEVVPQGINCTTVINIEAFSESGNTLILERSPKARLKRLKLNGKPVTWSESPSIDEPEQNADSEAPREVTVKLQQPLKVGKHVLECEFAMPLPRNSAWRLPRVRPGDMTWKKGTAKVSVQYPLNIAAVNPQDARQTAGGVTDSLQPSRDLFFDYYSRDANVELLVADQPAQLRCRSGTTITLGGVTTTATIVQQIEHVSGETFTLLADVHPEWKIESLDIQPNGILDHWSERDLPDDSSRSGDESRSSRPVRRQLEVRLLQAVSQDTPLTVRINAKRERLKRGSQLTVKQLEVLRLADVLLDSSLTAVRPFGTLSLRIDGENSMVPLNPESLSAAEKQLVAARRGDYVFEPSRGTEALRFTPLGGKPAWQAEIHATTTISETDVRDGVVVKCEPDFVTPEEVIIAVSPAREQPMIWRLIGSPDSNVRDFQLVVADLQPSELASADLHGDVQAWRIVLPEGLTGPFQLSGERFVKRPDDKILASSAWAPNALQLRSKTTVTADAPIASELSLLTELERLPVEQTSGKNSRRPVVGSCLISKRKFGNTRLLVRRNKPPARSWITSASTCSRFDKAGTHLHESCWQVENFGADEIRFQVDPNYKLHRLRVNHQPLVNFPIEPDNMLTVPVVPANQAIVISMSYSQKDTATGWWKRKLSVVPPQPTCPELSHRWQIRLPRGVAPYRPSRFAVSCIERLFGALARTTRPFDASGGSESLLEFGELENGRGEIAAYNVPATRLVGWLIFLSLVLLKTDFSVRTRIIVCSLAGCALMICALPWLGALRGLLWGVAVNWIRHQIPAAAALKNTVLNSRHGSTIRRTTVGAVGAIALLIVTALVRQGISQTPAARPVMPKHYRVLFPVDDKGDPSGNYIYVPQKMYDSLVKYSESQKSGRESWILNSATYKGRFSTRPNPDAGSGGKTADGKLDYTIDTIKSSYSITTFEPGLTIVLPLQFQATENISGRDEDATPEDGLRNEIRLDGQAIDWTPVDGGIQFSIGSKGKHDLAMVTRLQPDNAESNDGARRYRSMPVIPLANSQLELLVPGEDIGVTIESTIGGVTTSRAGRILTANIGPVPQLSIGWNPISRRIDREQQVVSKISRLNVLPGTAIYELCFIPSAEGSNSNGEANQLNEIRFTLDDQFRPLHSTQQNCNVEVTYADQRGRILTATRRSGSKDRHLKVALLLDGLAGTLPAEFQLPPVQLLDTELADERLGVSFDPGLSYVRTNNDAFQTVSIAEFNKRWPESSTSTEALPTIDYALLRIDPNTPWTIRPVVRQTKSLVRDRLTLEYGRESVEVKFRTEITSGEGEAFYHQLVGPKNLEISKVAVKSDEVEQKASWYKQDNGTISLFLDGKSSGVREIEVDGTVPLRLNTPTKMPLVFTKNSTTSAFQVNVYRRTEVLVEVPESEDVQPANIDDPTESSLENLIPVTAVTVKRTDNQAYPTVRVVANTPSLVGDSLTTIDMRSDGWFARYELKSEVTDGVPDVVRLAIPATWGDNFTITPAMPSSIESPDGSRRMELTPNPDSLDQRLDFIIEASVRSGETTELPRIELLGHEKVSNFVALPRRLGNLEREWNWESERLKTEELPEKFQTRENPRPGFSYYRSQGDHSARLLQPRELSAPEVLLKDVQLKIGNGVTTGIARFDLEPKGRSHGVLAIPPGTDIVAVLVDDRLADFEPTGENNQWRIAFGASRLPHQVEVVFQQEKQGSLFSTEQTIRVPGLVGGKVRKTVWAVDSNQSTPISADDRTVEITKPEYRQERITNALRTIRRTDEATTLYSLDEIGMWYAGWRERVFNRLNPVDPVGGAPLATATELDEVKGQVDALANNLRIPEPFLNDDSGAQLTETDTGWTGNSAASTPRTDDLLITSQRQGGKGATRQAKIGYMTTRDPSTLQMKFQREWLGGLGGRMIMTTVFLCLFVMAWRRLLVEPAASFALRWPHLLVAIIGVIWLLWLKFAWVGLVLIVIACWLALAGGVAIQGIQGLILRDSQTMISSEIQTRHL